MLENVNAIDWESLGNPNIPRWLEGLTSRDSLIQGHAIYRIAVDVVMEDEISDGNMRPTKPLSSDIPVKIIPFLIEILEADGDFPYEAVVGFLDTLASIHVRFGDSMGKWDLEQEHLDRAETMYKLIRNGEKVYLKLLNKGDAKLSQYVGYLLETLNLNGPAK